LKEISLKKTKRLSHKLKSFAGSFLDRRSRCDPATAITWAAVGASSHAPNKIGVGRHAPAPDGQEPAQQNPDLWDSPSAIARLRCTKN